MNCNEIWVRPAKGCKQLWNVRYDQIQNLEKNQFFLSRLKSKITEVLYDQSTYNHHNPFLTLLTIYVDYKLPDLDP